MKSAISGDVAPSGREPSVRSRLLVCSLLFLLACGVAVAFTVAGCGEEAGSEETATGVVVEESGSIDPGDAQDPNHGDRLYDSYDFEANKYDEVRIEVAAEGFSPLLLLVEVSTDAQLAEWQEEYSDEDALIYMIAGPGSYEARVYSMDGETGPYQIKVTLNR
jgi:hypothetical protein